MATSHSLSKRYNAITSESSDLSVAGQIVIFTFLALLIILLAGGIYHVCTRHWMDREDVEASSMFDNFTAVRPNRHKRNTMTLKLSALTRKAVDSEKVEEEKEMMDEKEKDTDSPGSCLSYTCSLLPIQPVPDDSSLATRSSSASIHSGLIPQILIHPCDGSKGPSDGPPSNTSDFPPSTSALLVQTLLASHSEMQVLPGVSSEAFLKVPAVSWTGRVVEPGEPTLPSSCSLSGSTSDSNSDYDYVTLSDSDNSDSDDSISIICDLIRPSSPTPPRINAAAAARNRPNLENPKTQLASSFSLDLDSILLPPANHASAHGYEYDCIDQADDSDSDSDGEEIYTGILSVSVRDDKNQEARTTVVVLPVVESP